MEHHDTGQNLHDKLNTRLISVFMSYRNQSHSENYGRIVNEDFCLKQIQVNQLFIAFRILSILQYT